MEIVAQLIACRAEKFDTPHRLTIAFKLANTFKFVKR